MSNRAQWTIFIAVVTLIFGVALVFIVRSKPRDVYLGDYSTQSAAVAAGLRAIAADALGHPAASSVTVHFRGPHAVPEGGEEAFSYNRRLSVLIAFLNVPRGASWKFVKLLCPHADNARLQALTQKPDVLLAAPQSCGCKTEAPNQLG